VDGETVPLPGASGHRAALPPGAPCDWHPTRRTNTIAAISLTITGTRCS